MGHLNEVEKDIQGQPRLSARGHGYILYYTRNILGKMGAINFRSFARTQTLNGDGQAFETSTHYQPRYPGSFLKARTGRLDLEFQAGKVHDRTEQVAMTSEDQARLADLLKYYPGLKVAPQFAPKKYRIYATEDDGRVYDLTAYSIWPVISPPNGHMRFLGQADTMTFSEPMLLTSGRWAGKEVVGLSYIDRQWADKYFGTYMIDDIKDAFKYGRALNYAHSWSAFHARNERTGEWSFFHIWHQWDRRASTGDQITDDALLLWTRGGVEQGVVSPSEYTWLPSYYVAYSGREVVMDYAMGQQGFFPSRAQFSSPRLGLTVDMAAQPALQVLNQPVYFFEGQASGTGTWNGDRLVVQGRLESSRLLYRTQDYREILSNLKHQPKGLDQPDLQKALVKMIAQRERDKGWLSHRLAVLANLLNELDLKLAIFRDILSGDRPSVEPTDPDVTIYP